MSSITAKEVRDCLLVAEKRKEEKWLKKIELIKRRARSICDDFPDADKIHRGIVRVIDYTIAEEVI
jgi:predicted protein tyrosine phosphatase